MRWKVAGLALLTLAGCTSTPPARVATRAPIEIQVLAFNDFHGNLETPTPFDLVEADGTTSKVTSGGAAHLAAALQKWRAGNPLSVTVSAGDTIGATPLTSALFLDEPTITAMDLLGLEFNAVGNHEFDKGVPELRRMQSGGCVQHTRARPCAVGPFAGGRFRYLAANVVQPDGTTVLPATGIKDFGPVQIGFIGMTLKETASLVTPSGVAGLSFADEAATANALVPGLKAQGADAIVLLIHQGGKLPTFNRGNGCEGLYGAIKPILARLDPAIATVVSGHTHWAYVCQSGAGGTQPRQLLTSAGKNGMMVTDIRLSFDPRTKELLGQRAENRLVGNGEHGSDAGVKAHVDKYVAAAAPLANRVVGSLTATATRSIHDGESAAANLIADSMLAATSEAGMGGAQIALVNATGVRVDLPGGEVKYREAFAMMPFQNNLVVMSLTGAELKAAIEQQFAMPIRAGFKDPSVLAVSEGFGYIFDLRRPVGSRVIGMTLNGKPVDPAATYRVAVNNYMASGGDGLTAFTRGRELADPGIVDIDALIAWIAPGRTLPAIGRVRAAN